MLGLLVATLAVLPVWTLSTSAQWGTLAALGILMAMAQACFVNAVARADASFVTPFSYMTLIFAILYDFALFDALPDSTSIVGAGIILTGATLLAWRENRKPSLQDIGR